MEEELNSSQVISDIENAFKRMFGLRKFEDAVAKAEEEVWLLNKSVDAISTGITIADLDGRILYTNLAGAKMHGYRPEEILGKDVNIFMPEDKSLKREKRDPEKVSEWKEWTRELIEVRKDGSEFPVRLTSIPVNDSSGKAVCIISLSEDITEIKHAQEMILESERKFRELADLLPGAVFETDEKGFFTYVNKYALETSGHTSEDIRNGLNCIEAFVPEDRERAMQNFGRRMQGEDLGDIEYRMLKKNGEILRVIVRADAILKDGRPAGLRGIVIDITRLKMIEDELKETIDTKDMLMKEIHHRVKNNMSVIQSLLSLQLRDVSDDKSKSYFKDARNRVKSMSMIHERLSRSEELSKMDLSEFIKSLAHHIFQSSELNPSKVQLVVNIPEISIDVETMMPCGLIINELVTNAFKYAFPDDRAGAVTIGLVVGKDNEITLSVKDDGVGISDDLNIYETKSLGLQIVSALTNQIQGDLELIKGNGTEIRITFKEKPFRQSF
jgi:PAS domain S-box-containing protein